MRLFRPPHACFRCAHSSSSLPLQSAAYASASTRSLCAPQRAHNAVSFCPVCSAAGSNASRVPVQSTGLEIRRARAPPATPARSRTLSHARRSPPSALLRTTCDAAPSPSRLARSVRAAVAVHLPPPRGEPGEERVASPLLPAGSCRTAGIEEMGLHRSRPSVGVPTDVPAWKQLLI
jgi:hypothetical protein